jgi:PIN domain nuclease of toxin-antitoxin system
VRLLLDTHIVIWFLTGDSREPLTLLTHEEQVAAYGDFIRLV